MATIVTVADLTELVDLWAVLLLSSPLPGVLATVSEEDVGAGRVEATLINRGLLGTRVLAHIEAEDVSAHLREVFLVDDRAAHWLLF